MNSQTNHSTSPPSWGCLELHTLYSVGFILKMDQVCSEDSVWLEILLCRVVFGKNLSISYAPAKLQKLHGQVSQMSSTIKKRFPFALFKDLFPEWVSVYRLSQICSSVHNKALYFRWKNTSHTCERSWTERGKRETTSSWRGIRSTPSGKSLKGNYMRSGLNWKTWRGLLKRMIGVIVWRIW